MAAAPKRLTELQATKLKRVFESAQAHALERPLQEIRVEEIAADSGVAASSLYKRFGTKEALVAAAIVNYFDESVGSLVADLDPVAPLQRLVYGLDTTANRIVEQPGIARTLMTIYFSDGPHQSTTQVLSRQIRETYRPILSDMHRRRFLAQWVDPAQLATHLCDRQFGVVSEWSLGRIRNRDLPGALRFAVLLILSGASVGKQAAEIRQLLASMSSRSTGGRRQR